MSIHISIFEHLTIKRDSKKSVQTDCNQVKSMVHNYLLSLTNPISLREACINMIYIYYDGEEVEFSGQVITSELQVAISEIRNADEIRVVTDYTHVGQMSNLDLGMDELSAYLAKANDNIFDSVRYVCYNFADSNPNDGGIIALFGKQAGKIVRGTISQKLVKNFPKNIPWHGVQTAVFVQGAAIKPESLETVKTSCQELTKLSYDDFSKVYRHFIDEGEDVIDFSMNNPILTSADDFDKFLSHINVIKNHTHKDDYVTTMPYLVNFSDHEPKILFLDIKSDGSCDYYLEQA